MRFLTKEYRMCVIIYKKMKINSIVRWYVYLFDDVGEAERIFKFEKRRFNDVRV